MLYNIYQSLISRFKRREEVYEEPLPTKVHKPFPRHWGELQIAQNSTSENYTNELVKIKNQLEKKSIGLDTHHYVQVTIVGFNSYEWFWSERETFEIIKSLDRYRRKVARDVPFFFAKKIVISAIDWMVTESIQQTIVFGTSGLRNKTQKTEEGVKISLFIEKEKRGIYLDEEFIRRYLTSWFDDEMKKYCSLKPPSYRFLVEFHKPNELNEIPLSKSILRTLKPYTSSLPFDD